jgi:hypothetical protein
MRTRRPGVGPIGRHALRGQIPPAPRSLSSSFAGQAASLQPWRHWPCDPARLHDGGRSRQPLPARQPATVQCDSLRLARRVVRVMCARSSHDRPPPHGASPERTNGSTRGHCRGKGRGRRSGYRQRTRAQAATRPHTRLRSSHQCTASTSSRRGAARYPEILAPICSSTCCFRESPFRAGERTLTCPGHAAGPPPMQIRCFVPEA